MGGEDIFGKAYALSRQFGFSPDDREDIEQDMMLYLYEALQSYNPKKGAVSTFVDRIATHWVGMAIRTRSAIKRDYRAILCSLDDFLTAGDEDSGRIADSISIEDLPVEQMPLGCIEQVELAIDINRVITGLPSELKELSEALMTQTIQEYCRSTSTPRSTVDSRVKKLRKIFTRAGFGYQKK